MVVIRRVLCPVDFSDFSRRALDYAIAIAGWYKATLTVLYVHHVAVSSIAEFVGIASGAADCLALSAAERAHLQDELRALTPDDALKTLPIDFVVLDGDIAAEILTASQTADLLVMGTHGRSGFDRLILGSVAERVLHGATRPVLTIPPVGTQAGIPSQTLFDRVIAAVDFSESSLHALAYALSLAAAAHAPLSVLHVAHVPAELGEWASRDAEGQRYLERWTALAHERLRPIVAEAAREYDRVHAQVVTGEPYREIVRAAADPGAALIAVGGHGRGAVERIVIGSTAQHVVRQAACPVLSIRDVAGARRGSRMAGGTAPDHASHAG